MTWGIAIGVIVGTILGRVIADLMWHPHPALVRPLSFVVEPIRTVLHYLIQALQWRPKR